MKLTMQFWIVLLTVNAASGPKVWCESIEGMRRASRSSEYVEPTQGELECAEELFLLLFRGEEEKGAVRRLCDVLRMETVLVQERDERFAVLREGAKERRGWGLYVFRSGKCSPVALEAPHSWDDADTGKIAELLFLEGKSAAVAWNTASRRAPVEGKCGHADLARVEGSLMHAFTRAFIRTFEKGIVVQIHGFDRGLRRSRRGAESEVILSTGARLPEDWVAELGDCLSAGLEKVVSVYPRDLNELGGRGNTHGRLIRAAGHGRFLHVEIGLELRKGLVGSAELRKRLWACVPERQP
jgi:hypothetical protein